MKSYLVNYTGISGEYEFSSCQTIITVDDSISEDDAVHNYFVNFYSDVDNEDIDISERYTYQCSNVAIEINTKCIDTIRYKI